MTGQVSGRFDGSTATGAVTDDDVTESIERLGKSSQLEVLIDVTAGLVDTNFTQRRRRRSTGDGEGSRTLIRSTPASDSDEDRLTGEHCADVDDRVESLASGRSVSIAVTGQQVQSTTPAGVGGKVGVETSRITGINHNVTGDGGGVAVPSVTGVVAKGRCATDRSRFGAIGEAGGVEGVGTFSHGDGRGALVASDRTWTGALVIDSKIDDEHRLRETDGIRRSEVRQSAWSRSQIAVSGLSDSDTWLERIRTSCVVNRHDHGLAAFQCHRCRQGVGLVGTRHGIHHGETLTAQQGAVCEVRNTTTGVEVNLKINRLTRSRIRRCSGLDSEGDAGHAHTVGAVETGGVVTARPVILEVGTPDRTTRFGDRLWCL